MDKAERISTGRITMIAHAERESALAKLVEDREDRAKRARAKEAMAAGAKASEKAYLERIDIGSNAKGVAEAAARKKEAKIDEAKISEIGEKAARDAVLYHVGQAAWEAATDTAWGELAKERAMTLSARSAEVNAIGAEARKAAVDATAVKIEALGTASITDLVKGAGGASGGAGRSS